MDHKVTAQADQVLILAGSNLFSWTDKVDEDDFGSIAFITIEVTTNRRGHNTQQG